MALMNQFSHKHKSTILVTGGAGFIGSHVNKMLHDHGYQTIVLDNLSQGCREAVTCGTFIEGNIADITLLNKILSDSPIDAVMHFAASIQVGESMSHPAKYYINNVANTLNLLEAMRRHQVNTLVFSSSAAIFGAPKKPRITEDHPCIPINPYGQSKFMVEKILVDYDRAYNLKSSCLRYFNASGGDPSGKIKNIKSAEVNLIPLVLGSLLDPQKTITIFGTDYPTPDGTCIRDYIHIHDLGMAHILAMEKLLKDRSSSHYNLGNGNGYSVREVIETAEKVSGLKVNAIEGERRPGDPAILVADAEKARRELGWKPQYPALETIIEHAWRAIPR